MQRVLTALGAVVLVCIFSTPSPGIIQFHKEFVAVYVEQSDNEEFVRAVKEARCFICHVGKKRTNRNVYGQQLSELLDKKADRANKKKIHEALAQVAQMPSDPENEKSPTFGELIKTGQLPGGEIQKEDPK